MTKPPFLRTVGLELAKNYPKQETPCSVFGECGGCSYLDLSYENELEIKNQVFQSLIQAHQLDITSEAIVTSPIHEAYRIKISPQFKKLKDGRLVFGTAPFGKKSILEIEACPIAQTKISEQIPVVRKALNDFEPLKKNRGCIVMRCDEHQFKWGGLGKGSLKLDPQHYFKYHYQDKVIHYSLDTFFQANTAILPTLFEQLKRDLQLQQHTHLYDLYGGVGLFSIALGAELGAVTLVELEGASSQLAEYNKNMNKMEHLNIHCSAVEKLLPLPPSPKENMNKVAIIDPPRAGLHSSVIEHLNQMPFKTLAYLSCNPETQMRDLKHFTSLGWSIQSLTPYDFFPRSYHIESLAILVPPKSI